MTLGVRLTDSCTVGYNCRLFWPAQNHKTSVTVSSQLPAMAVTCGLLPVHYCTAITYSVTQKTSECLDRFTAHDPVRRGCDQSQRTQFRWNKVSWDEVGWDKWHERSVIMLRRINRDTVSKASLYLKASASSGRHISVSRKKFLRKGKVKGADTGRLDIGELNY